MGGGLPQWKQRLLVAAGAILGITYFAHYFGLWRVDPGSFQWVMQGMDQRWHNASWQAFRREPWGWPPGRIDRILYPVGTSVANTDSIPLLAIFLKPWSAYLSTDFQYFGIWLVSCAALHGAWAAMLMRLTGGGLIFQLLGIGLLLLTPIAVPSIDHAALSAADWVTMAGLWLYFRPRVHSHGRELSEWSAFGMIAASIHAYVCLMALAIATAGCVRRWWPDRVLTAPRAALHLTSMLALVMLMLYLNGFFVLGRYSDLTGGALGHWSMNLLAPINPSYWSNFLPSLPLATSGQGEGFAYFGLGILVLLVASAIILFVQAPTRNTLAEIAPVLLTTGVLVVVAISPKVTFGPYVLFELPQALYAPFLPFRASGRLFQPAFYLMLFLVLRMLARRLPSWQASLALLAVLTIQYADIVDPMERHLRPVAVRGAFQTWQQPLHWDAWRFATDHYRRLLLFPPDNWGTSTTLAFSYLAARSGMAVNQGEPGRVDFAALYAARRELERQVAAGELDRDAVYIVRDDRLSEWLNRLGDRVACTRVDGFNACTPRGAGGSLPAPE